MTGPDVTVLGAGIAGLACACALAQAGANVRVLERARTLAGVGAGIQISPNGFAVLRALGLELRIGELADASDAAVLRVGATGRRLIRLPMAGRRFYLIHRADLIAVLARGAKDAGATIETGRIADRVTVTDTGCTLNFEGGQVESAPLLVAADGIRSLVRPVLNGAATASFTGQVAWRALVPGDGPPEATVFVGAGRHLVRYPLSHRGMINLVGVEERARWAPESWTAKDDPDNFRRAFGGFCPAVQDDLALVSEVNLWGLFRHPVAERWHGGRAVLIGDAAHPTLPFLAQGANLALEDAFVLADCLAHHCVADALSLYQTRRRLRTLRAVRAANANARNYHLSRWWQTWPAHTALRAMDRLAPSLMMRQFDWLHGHDVTAAERR